MIRPAAPDESPALVALADATGLFAPGEATALLGGVLEEFHAGRLGEGHQVVVSAGAPDSSPAGWAYFAPDAHSEGIWNLWWIGVSPTRQGGGVGGGLMAFVEAEVRAAGGRVLVVETSSLPQLVGTRRFYAARGYAECGRVPDFYAAGDDKVIFARRIAAG